MIIETSEKLMQWIKPRVMVSSLKDFGIVLSLSNPLIDHFADALASLRGIDASSQAEVLLKQLLESLFTLKEFVTGGDDFANALFRT